MDMFCFTENSLGRCVHAWKYLVYKALVDELQVGADVVFV